MTLRHRLITILLALFVSALASAQCVDYGSLSEDPPMTSLSLSPDDINDFILVGDLAWVARSLYGALVAVDYSDPDAPVVLGSEPVDVMNEVYDVDVEGSLAFLTYLQWGGATGVRVFDISDPADPVDIGDVSAPGGRWAWQVAAAGDYAYASFAYYTFGVIDVTTPAAPVLVSELPVDHPGQITVLGDHVIVTSEASAPLIIDVTDPLAPAVVDTLATSGGGNFVTVAGNLAYVSTSTSFDIVDITDLLDSALLSTSPLPWPDYHLGVSVSGDLAYVACKDNGVQIFDVSDPVASTLIGAVNIAGYPYSAQELGDRLIVLSSGLLHTAPAQCQPVAAVPDQKSLRLSNRPNPFNPRTVVSFELVEPGVATLVIHDAAGRLVRTLVDGEMLGAGSHDRRWAGRDDRGREVASGVYYCRLSAGGRRSVHALTLVR